MSPSEFIQVAIGDLNGQLSCAQSMHSIKEDGAFIYFGEPDRQEDIGVSYPSDVSAVLAQIENDSFWFRHRNRLITEMAAKYAPGARFCDVGGGNGIVAQAMMQAGHEVLLLEPGMTACKEARETRKIPVVYQCILEEAPIPKGSISLLGAFDVVEHIEDPVNFLRQTCDLAATDATLLITVPAFPSLWSQEDIDAGHYRRYTKRTMRQHLEGAGWEVERLFYFFSMLPMPIFMKRSIPYRLGQNQTGAYSSVENASKDHLPGNSSITKIVDGYLTLESKMIHSRLAPPFGSSLFAIAKKP